MGESKKSRRQAMLLDSPWSEYDQMLEQRLSKKRYKHSLAVMERAIELARRFGADEEKAKLAGLLHDVMKDTEDKILLQFIEDSDILLTYADRAAPQLWHAIGATVFLQKSLGIVDEDVLAAVRYHTTGRAGMSLLEKVVYLADLTSSDRDYGDVAKTRRIVDRDLDQGMLYSMKFLIGDLVARGRLLHPDTLACYDELVRAGVQIS